MPTHTCTYPENLTKIGPVNYEIITGLQGDRFKKKYNRQNINPPGLPMQGGLINLNDAELYNYTQNY